MYEILAYVTGAISIAVALLTFAFPQRKTQLIFKMSSDLIGISNLVFILLAKNNMVFLSGVISLAISFLRDIVYIFRNDVKCFNSIFWPIGFSIALVCMAFLSFKGLVSLLPIVGSVICTLTLYANDVRISKTGAIVGITLYIIYYAILIPTSDVLTVFSLCNSIAGVVGAMVGLFLFLKKRKEGEKKAS